MKLDIKRNGTRPSEKGEAENFTGAVRRDPVIEAPAAPARLRTSVVTFEPRARTAWHWHPLGQTLFVLSGLGRVQRKGCPIEEIRPGDVVWIPPGEEHWHGASPTVAMSHLAMHEVLDGKHIKWLEKVSDQEYEGEVEPE